MPALSISWGKVPFYVIQYDNNNTQMMFIREKSLPIFIAIN